METHQDWNSQGCNLEVFKGTGVITITQIYKLDVSFDTWKMALLKKLTLWKVSRLNIVDIMEKLKVFQFQLFLIYFVITKQELLSFIVDGFSWGEYLSMMALNTWTVIH